MTLHIPISPETESQLREKAVAVGKDVVQLARELIEQGVGGPNGSISPETAEARLSALHRMIARARHQGERLPAGYVVDDSRESIYEGRGE